MADVTVGDEEIAAVVDVLRSRWLSMGPVTEEFERRFREYVGVRHAFAVANGTAALHLAHLALGSGPGDRILCPSLTFVATANAIRYTGATPVFVDITSTDDLNCAPAAIEATIDESTRGICVVHYAGYPCDMHRILAIAERHGLYVVEDAAHAAGAATWMPDPSRERGVLKMCGSLGDIGCFSFFANKNMTTGEGGMITTDDDEVAARIKLLRAHGMTSLTWDREKGHSVGYDVHALGYNYRLDEIRAAIGLVQLSKLEHNNQRRAEVVKTYRDALRDMSGVSVPFERSDAVSAHHIFPILLATAEDRAGFIEFMRARGIQTSIHYRPIHTFSDYCEYRNAPLPVTEDVAARVVTLPLYPGMTADRTGYVIEAVRHWASRVAVSA